MWLAARGAPPFKFEEDQDVVIGRDQDCDLFLYSTMLSRRHASVRWQHGVPVLFDLDSLNGTFMGPDRIRRRRLQDGDVFRLGDIPVLFTKCDGPPDPPADTDTILLEEAEESAAPAADSEASLETRIFSRSHAFHQDVFKFNELEQLRPKIAGFEEALEDDAIAGDDLSAWWQRAPEARSRALLELLRCGVVQPRATTISLHALDPAERARHCVLTQRGGKLRRLLANGRTTWNEMASLRYQSRRSPLFNALRMAARAYRPGGGLDELDVPTLAYELENIYAPDLDAATLDGELRNLMLLGVIQPGADTGWEAWYPARWDDPQLVRIAKRGLNLLHGFRLEDEQE
ncbi:MAG: FHA domain-containing protein [Planctomycetota bacterium]